MPRFDPFHAVRYRPDRVQLADVVGPPYDIVSRDERARLEARSPYNVVHIDLARDEPTRNRYEVAGCRFREWLDDGILTVDDEAAFYVYAMGWRDDEGRLHQTTGVLGALALDAARAGDVLPHERTMAKPMDDRLRLLRACRANLSPIWGLSLARDIGAAEPPSVPPLARCTDDSGVHHRLWPVTAPAQIEAIALAASSAPVVIADGHHRYETALAYQAERRAAGLGTPADDFVLAYVAALETADVGVRPIHRLLAGLPATFPLVEALSARFGVEEVGGPTDELIARMAEAGALGLVVRDHAYLLRPRLRQGDDELADSERFEAARGAFPRHELAFHPDAHHVIALVDKGEAQAGVLLRPATVEQIAAAARAGRRLPQKTTYFFPKPRTGMAFRLLDA